MVSFTNWMKILENFRFSGLVFFKGALITSLPKILPRKFIDDLPDRRPLKWFSFVKILLYLKYDAIILK
jgi:hypothetical protein